MQPPLSLEEAQVMLDSVRKVMLSDDAKLAIISHELSHLVAVEGFIDSVESSVTLDSMRIGSRCCRQLFKDIRIGGSRGPQR